MAREHKKRGYKMAPFTLVMQVMKGQLRQYVELHGTECLAPARKNTLTNVLIIKMLSTPEGSTHGRLKVKWGSYFWVSVMATFSMQAETGARKAEVSKATATTASGKGRLTFASITWFINGIRTAAPTIEQLLAITWGSGCWIVFGALKNDPFGEFFGSKPAWMPFSADAQRNACRALVALEILAAEGEGLRPAIARRHLSSVRRSGRSGATPSSTMSSSRCCAAARASPRRSAGPTACTRSASSSPAPSTRPSAPTSASWPSCAGGASTPS